MKDMKISKPVFAVILVSAFIAGALTLYGVSPYITSRTGISIPPEDTVVLTGGPEETPVANDITRAIAEDASGITDSDLNLDVSLPSDWIYTASWSKEKEARLMLSGPQGEVYIAQVAGLGGTCTDPSGNPAWKSMLVDANQMQYCDVNTDREGRRVYSFDGLVHRGIPIGIVAFVRPPFEENRETVLGIVRTIHFK